MMTADQLYDDSGGGKELVWLRGKMSTGFKLTMVERIRKRNAEYLEKEEKYRLCLRQLLLWEDTTQYQFCEDVNQCISRTI